ncbi:uncharacterized protein K452DRAFT_144561 [Aplosporella prunicola CBS 121167]|uniref:Uncharacterized protein n=1 Tax=Aplosporella prunicola CBS 121167 TaxID=1176127 RepID=A0A6A6BMH4_9PEZI|nr:uncharacterized protein K452DRAFT_144561 [Aplosporella prunicola CBS 121167]KAF2144603.1 hypothetical protein K452DRAFT_144561 [Aplosporella prunicola CBS 121167]
MQHAACFIGRFAWRRRRKLTDCQAAVAFSQAALAGPWSFFFFFFLKLPVLCCWRPRKEKGPITPGILSSLFLHKIACELAGLGLLLASAATADADLAMCHMRARAVGPQHARAPIAPAPRTAPAPSSE